MGSRVEYSCLEARCERIGVLDWSLARLILMTCRQEEERMVNLERIRLDCSPEFGVLDISLILKILEVRKCCTVIGSGIRVGISASNFPRYAFAYRTHSSPIHGAALPNRQSNLMAVNVIDAASPKSRSEIKGIRR